MVLTGNMTIVHPLNSLQEVIVQALNNSLALKGAIVQALITSLALQEASVHTLITSLALQEAIVHTLNSSLAPQEVIVHTLSSNSLAPQEAIIHPLTSNSLVPQEVTNSLALHGVIIHCLSNSNNLDHLLGYQEMHHLPNKCNNSRDLMNRVLLLHCGSHSNSSNMAPLHPEVSR